MRAIVIKSYGMPEVLQLVNLSLPTVGTKEVLVKNLAISVNPYDCMARSGAIRMFTGFKFPKTLGGECAGEVVQTGAEVKNFKPGDLVIVFTGREGSYTEFLSRSEKDLIRLPAGVSPAEGACLPIAGTSAFDCVHKLGKIKRDSRVLINGAYGAVGSFAVQLAKLAGAHVTGVCSTSSLEQVRALGADEVIDYTKTDVLRLSNQYDIVLDTPSAWSFGKAKHMLNPDGVFISTVPSLGRMLTLLFTLPMGRKGRVLFAAPSGERIALLANLVLDKKLKVVIDRTYTADQIAEAHRYSESKRAKGKIIVQF